MENPAMQFYRQAKEQFEQWLREPASDLEPDAIRRCIADCHKRLRELEGKKRKH